MNTFKEFNITNTKTTYTGEKIKISKILNREITVHGYKLEQSKFEGNGECLHLQISLNGIKYVLFTGSASLMSMIVKVPANGLPFITTIIEDNQRFEFT